MKTRLRLALPPLAQFAPHSDIAFALFDRAGRLLRSGRLPAAEIAEAVAGHDVTAILHPLDAIVVEVNVPPLPARRLEAAVHGRVEPMSLSDIDDLYVTYGSRSEAGLIQVSWADRQALDSAWRLLVDAGLSVAAIIPSPLALPPDDPEPDSPLDLPVDDRWNMPLPKLSFARPQWRPASQQQRWRNAAAWCAAAVVVWLLGINVYAAQLRSEMQNLQASMEQAVRTAYPTLPAILDPLRQARNQRDLLRKSSGNPADDDFIALALGAAKVLRFAEGHVASIDYKGGRLRLDLAEGYTPPTNEATLHQTAAVQSIVLQKDETKANTWYVSRSAAAPNAGVAR